MGGQRRGDGRKTNGRSSGANGVHQVCIKHGCRLELEGALQEDVLARSTSLRIIKTKKKTMGRCLQRLFQPEFYHEIGKFHSLKLNR